MLKGWGSCLVDECDFLAQYSLKELIVSVMGGDLFSRAIQILYFLEYIPHLLMMRRPMLMTLRSSIG
jgi:hypothetical protein